MEELGKKLLKVPLVTVISLSTKLVVASLTSNLKEKVAFELVAPFTTSPLEIAMVGAVPS